MRKRVVISRAGKEPVQLMCNEVAYKVNTDGTLTVLLEGAVQWCNMFNGCPVGEVCGDMVFSKVEHIQWTKGE